MAWWVVGFISSHPFPGNCSVTGFLSSALSFPPLGLAPFAISALLVGVFEVQASDRARLLNYYFSSWFRNGGRGLRRFSADFFRQQALELEGIIGANRDAPGFPAADARLRNAGEIGDLRLRHGQGAQLPDDVDGFGHGEIICMNAIKLQIRFIRKCILK